MLLSTMTGGISKRLGDKEAIRLIAEAGFDSYDFSFHVHKDDSPIYSNSYKEYAEELREFSDNQNILCTQAHAYFHSGKYGDDEFNKTAFEKIVRDMEFASILGAKIIVVHPIKHFPEGINIDKMQYNIDFYKRLLPYCQKWGIKVALENLFIRDKKKDCYINGACGFAKEFSAYLEGLDSDYFVACFDTGHVVLVGEDPYHAIQLLGQKHLHALHVHDNDFCEDLHTIPFMGKIDWEKICRALAEIDYNDEFTYEADSFLNKLPTQLFPQALSLMHRIGRMLINRIEKLKSNVELEAKI